MSTTHNKQEASLLQQRQKALELYWAGDLSRNRYLLRRQRKEILENCRRIAVVGVSSDPESTSFVAMEKLLGLGLEIIPISTDRTSLLGLRCYPKLTDFPGTIDLVEVHAGAEIGLHELAAQAVAKKISTVWLEGDTAPPDVEAMLADGSVQLVQYENLFAEYVKHTASAVVPHARREKRATRVRERMSRDPATVKPDDALKDAIWKMEHGQFRHLPVTDDEGKVIGMLSDRDVRLIRPSLAFVDKKEAMVQLWSLTVQDAAVFDPITVKEETTIREAAELMLRWHVGGLPVVNEEDKPVGMLTYTDLLRELVGSDPPNSEKT
jgi:CBS domain-containing protein